NFTMNNTSQTVTVTFNATATTTTTVTSLANTSTFGQSVTFTATVSRASGSGAPVGTVQFKVDGVNLGTPVTLTSVSTTSASATSVATTTLAVGTRVITAEYTPGTGFSASTGTLTGGQVINKVDPTCTVNGFTGPYDGAAHGATGSCKGVGDVVLTGLDLGSSFTNVPGGTANWTFT